MYYATTMFHSYGVKKITIGKVAYPKKKKWAETFNGLVSGNIGRKTWCETSDVNVAL